MGPACSFCSVQAATLLEFLLPLTSRFVLTCFCVVLGPKPPLHRYNWLSFGKFQDTERFLISCPRHVSSWQLHSSETGSTSWRLLPKLGEILCLLLYSFLLCLVVTLRSWEFPERLMNYHIYTRITVRLILKVNIDEGWKYKEKWRYKGLSKYTE
jgi:hypothetical protein